MKKRVLIGQGKGIFNFTLEGQAVVVDDPQDYINKCKDKIIVVKSPTPEIYILIPENEVYG